MAAHAFTLFDTSIGRCAIAWGARGDSKYRDMLLHTGMPFNANCIDVAGNMTANMRANVAAEAVGRTLAARLRELTDDPGMKDMLSFLIARERWTSSSGWP